MFGKTILPSLFAVAILSCATAAQALVTIETVPVGNPGNVGKLAGWDADGIGPNRICGEVDYIYNIGKYEVTSGQYTEFLNRKASVTDTYGLYDLNMQYGTGGCRIRRTGGGTTGNPYSYSVDSNWANRPVNFVSYWDACRFANWLNNGQGDGDTETGAYTLNGYNDVDGRNITRNPGAKWCLASEDEWYKAAYHDKSAGQAAIYFDYATSSNEAPGQNIADASGNNANYRTAPHVYPIDSGRYTTLVGEFQDSASSYGTFDQSGNVWEWNEAIVYEWNTRTSHVIRGGSFGDNSDYLLASCRYACSPPSGTGLNSLGFRVVYIPEPGSMAMLAGVALTALCWRRKRA